MKKLALTFGAIVLGFVLTSCGDNKKETVMQLFNTFFDEEVTFLNQVTSAADFLEYDQASDQRLEEFYAKMSQDFPMDENGEIINLGKEDNEEVKKALMAREDAYVNLYDAKRTELYEPYIADLENFWNGELDEFFGQFENEKELTDEKIMPMFQKFEEKFHLADEYVPLSNEEQFERYFNIADQVYGDEEETEAEE
ncbi:MAG: hypothetical protein II887_08055 [Bacteroidales bacterium]|nr:hypothetical protein [Bacteroidales bacterium]